MGNQFLTAFLFLITLPAASFGLTFGSGPYPGPVGSPTSQAIGSEDGAIRGWASGYLGLSYGTNVSERWKTPLAGIGPAMPEYTADPFGIVSLGRGGSIILEFSPAIANGAGPDFAVFENSFSDYFLELAYVEVSSDGVTWQGFPSVSLTEDPVGAFGLVDTTQVDQLAGKYRVGWGTPFDLDDLISTDGVNLNNVRYVKLIDVVGDGSNLDSQGNPIYDPYPTTGSAGFDLDAVAVLNAAVSPDAIPGLYIELVNNSTVRLRLAGGSGLRYVIEGSHDLLRWTQIEVVDLPASPGATMVRTTSDHLVSLDRPDTHRFHRARLIGRSP